MQKYLVLILILIFSITAYAKECDYYIKDDNETALLLVSGVYKDKNATGNVCIKDDNTLMLFKVKNGKLTGYANMKIQEEDNLKIDLWMSDYKFIMAFFLSMEKNNSFNNKFYNSLSNFQNMDMGFKIYHTDKLVLHTDLKQGKGFSKVFNDDGSLFMYNNIENGDLNGVTEIYKPNGRLEATLIYKDGKAISGECAESRSNGSKLSRAELENWENGLSLDCSY